MALCMILHILNDVPSGEVHCNTICVFDCDEDEVTDFGERTRYVNGKCVWWSSDISFVSYRMCCDDDGVVDATTLMFMVQTSEHFITPFFMSIATDDDVSVGSLFKSEQLLSERYGLVTAHGHNHILVCDHPYIDPSKFECESGLVGPAYIDVNGTFSGAMEVDDSSLIIFQPMHELINN